MNLHQLRFALEVKKRGLNLTDAAKALHTSQPGVSKGILELEDELGIDLFVRHGKRIKDITEPGKQALAVIDNILREVTNLKRIGEQFSDQDAGTLSIATTHTQARYVLPTPIGQLRQNYPKVNISLHQGSPDQVAKMLIDGVAEVGIATESLADYAQLITLPCYEWEHVLVIPKGHAILSNNIIDINRLGSEPLVTYHPTFTGRTKVDVAFAKAKINPTIALEAIDSDVIKTYVATGLGIGIVAQMAILPADREQFEIRPAGDLFGKNVARLAFKRGAYLRSFIFDFVKNLNPELTQSKLERAMKSDFLDQDL